MAHMLIRGDNSPIPLQTHEALKIRDTLTLDREDRPETIEIDNMVVKVADIKVVNIRDENIRDEKQKDYWGDWLLERKKWNESSSKEKANSSIGVFNSLFRSVYNREPSVEESSRAVEIREEFFEANKQWTIDPPELYPGLVDKIPKSQRFTLEKIKQRASNEKNLAGKAIIGNLIWN